MFLRNKKCDKIKKNWLHNFYTNNSNNHTIMYQALLLDMSFEDRFYAYYEKRSANPEDASDMNEALAYAMFEKKFQEAHSRGK